MKIRKEYVNPYYTIEHMIEPTRYVDYQFDETSNPKLLKILEDEKWNADIPSYDIALMLPDEPERYYREDPGLLARVGRSIQGYYHIKLNPIAIKNSKRILREIIGHEICHIKEGDVDRNLPTIIKWAHNKLIEEPRARRYE